MGSTEVNQFQLVSAAIEFPRLLQVANNFSWEGQRGDEKMGFEGLLELGRGEGEQS